MNTQITQTEIDRLQRAMVENYDTAKAQLEKTGLFGKELDRKARKLALKMSGETIPTGCTIAIATPNGWGKGPLGYRGNTSAEMRENKPQSPTPAQVLAMRQTAGLSQAQAAARVYAKTYRTWQDWERGVRNMPAAEFALWQAQNKYPDLIPDYLIT